MKKLPTTVKCCYNCPYRIQLKGAGFLEGFFCKISDARPELGFTSEGISKVCPLEDVDEGPDTSYGDMIGQGGH